MELFAVGFIVLVITAALMGVLVGAIGGAVAWRLRTGIALGWVLTACAYLLVLVLEHHEDFIWLRAKLTWGAPSMTLAFLVSSMSARWLEARTALRPIVTAIAALAFSICIGFFYLLLFRINLQAPLLTAMVTNACLILLLIFHRRLVRQ